MELGIIFKFDSIDKLVEYKNSDWIGLKDRGRSTDRFIFLVKKELISHPSKQNANFALFLTEEAYMVMTEVGKKAL